MKGVMMAEAREMLLRPPKMTSPSTPASARPIQSGLTPKALLMAAPRPLAWTVVRQRP